ncbi:MAG: protease pro-enzyme activation domain-containing protein [Candidatus Acidiferrales bacterium]
MIRRLTTFLFTIVALLTGVNFVCQAQTQPLLTRHVREVTVNGQAQFVKKLPAAQSMRVDVVLPIRNQSELDSFLQELYDPSSPFYRHFLTVQEFTARFGPTQENYNALVNYAKANGFSVVGGSRDAMDVQLTGTVATIESAFHVTMNVYQHPTEDRTFYAPDREPTVDLPFQLWHISGLDNFSTPHPLYHRRDVNVKPNATTGSGPSASFLGSDMRAAYYGSGSLTGSGQNIGLLEYAGFDIADVNTYYTNAKQTRTAAVTGISTDGTSINCSGSCDDTEQTLDVTQALGMAPGVTTVYVYVGSTDTAVLGSMSSHSPLPLQLSSSWTWTPADPTTDDPYFEKMATQGQTIFQASGDSGHWTSSFYPSEDQHVICVGGTDLTTASAGGAWASESAWVDGGGGYYAKDDILIPSYQQLSGVITSANKGSTTYRNGPDVSANANFTFYVCADQTTCTANDYGGTSFAAPMWAGYLALANQQAAASGDAAPGFINPAVYAIGVSSSYDTDFHDITSGSNGFSAVTGYDLATGWGSPNGAALINALAPTSKTPNFTISASPTSVSVVQGNSGTSTITTAVSGGFSAAVALTASGQPTGVTVAFNPTSIAAPGSGTSTMTMTVASTTATGTYSIVVTGTGGGVTQTTSVSLTVTAPVSGSFTLTASPTSLTVDRSAKGTSTITIHPANGFTGSVTLSATGMGSGVTAAFGTNPATSTSVLTLTASSSATTGTYTITVHGTSGSLSPTTTISHRIRR